jgi:hypothetical protein
MPSKHVVWIEKTRIVSSTHPSDAIIMCYHNDTRFTSLTSGKDYTGGHPKSTRRYEVGPKIGEENPFPSESKLPQDEQSKNCITVITRNATMTMLSNHHPHNNTTTSPHKSKISST